MQLKEPAVYPYNFRSEEVYTPEEDTFLLLKAALAEAKPEDRVLEVGCGSGFISRELALQVGSSSRDRH